MSVTLKKAGSSRYILLFLLITGCTSGPGKTTYRSYTIEINQMKFQPAELFVHQYDTVVFVNHDLVIHDITEETSKAWSSSALLVDSSWKLVATGSSNYFCSIHPVMKGKIIVQ